MKKLFYFLPLLVLLSCNNDDNNIQEESYTPYPKGYFVFNSGVMDTIKLEYDNNKVIKRIGDWIQLSNSTGFNNSFSKDIENHISYNGDLASLNKISKSGEVTFNQLITYKLNSQGKIYEAVHTSLSRPNYSEKYVYMYDNNQLKNIDLFVTDNYYTNDLRSRQDFYFNKNENLDSIVYRKAIYDFYDESIAPYIDYKVKERKVTKFTNYDSAKNPFINLGLFTDLFFQSLSKNNFRKIENTTFDQNGKNIGIEESSWEYEYINGEVKVLK